MAFLYYRDDTPVENTKRVPIKQWKNNEVNLKYVDKKTIVKPKWENTGIYIINEAEISILEASN